MDFWFGRIVQLKVLKHMIITFRLLKIMSNEHLEE